jgi:hypothetical protein
MRTSKNSSFVAVEHCETTFADIKVSEHISDILIMFFCVKALCGLFGRSQRFGEGCCLYLQG